ncbi:hypothetical protein ACU686_26140 [Yinghuangia aomiensis]
MVAGSGSGAVVGASVGAGCSGAAVFARLARRGLVVFLAVVISGGLLGWFRLGRPPRLALRAGRCW